MVGTAWPEAPRLFRDYTSEMLGELKTQASEDVLLELLESTQDIEERTFLCLSLCRLFSRRGLDVALQQIEKGYDESLVSLEHEVLTVADALGVGLPPASARWRKDRENEERRMGKLSEEQ
jgi:hypothetical protein